MTSEPGVGAPDTGAVRAKRRNEITIQAGSAMSTRTTRFRATAFDCEFRLKGNGKLAWNVAFREFEAMLDSLKGIERVFDALQRLRNLSGG